MAYGLQVFREDGSLDFDSVNGHTWKLYSTEVVTITPTTFKTLNVPPNYTHDTHLITYSVTQGQVLYTHKYNPDSIQIRQISSIVPDGIAIFNIYERWT